MNPHLIFKYFFVFLGIVFLYPTISLAGNISYGKILSQENDSFVLQYGNTEAPDFYNCTVSTLLCTNLGKTKPENESISSTETTPPFSFSTKSTWKKNIHTRYLYLTDNTTGKTYTRSYTLSFWDTLGSEGSIYAFSPDYKKLLYKDDSTGYPVLYELDLSKLKGKTFKGKKVFDKSFSVGGFTLTKKGEMYFIANKDSSYEWNLYKYNFTTKKASLVAKNASYAFKIRKFENGIVFFVIEGASSFPVFYNELTSKLEKFTGIVADTSPAIVNSKAVPLGGNLHGVLVTSQNFDKNSPHPLIIWLHGGPYRQTSLGFHSYSSYAVYDLILNELAKNNVAVLKLDYRGSYGYGVKFSDSIKGNVGKGDVIDVVNALKVVKKDLKVSDTYLMGNSYGGYLALRGVVAYPKTFAGAISINGVTDWKVMLEKLQNSIFNANFNGKPKASNKKLYDKASIISRIDGLTDQKIILIQAQSDKTIPPSQADLLYEALKEKNKNVEFYPYEGEDHVFKKTSSIEGICKNIFTTLALPLEGNCSFQ